MLVAGRYPRGIYVYTFTKITEGPFKGSNKISWLNNYDYRLIEDRGSKLLIEITTLLARDKGIIS